MYMGAIIFFAKNKKELATLIPTVRIYSQDIGMEFDIEKSTILVIKSSKWRMVEGVEQTNQVAIRTFGEKETYKYLGILEADTIKQVKMKEKNFKKVSRKNQKITRDKTL